MTGIVSIVSIHMESKNKKQKTEIPSVEEMKDLVSRETDSKWCSCHQNEIFNALMNVRRRKVTVDHCASHHPSLEVILKSSSVLAPESDDDGVQIILLTLSSLR